MKRKIPKSNAPDINREHAINHLNNSINTLSDFNLKVKIVFQMIDETNSINQLLCMQQECKEEGRPHLVAYIDNRISQLRERYV